MELQTKFPHFEIYRIDQLPARTDCKTFSRTRNSPLISPSWKYINLRTLNELFSWTSALSIFEKCSSAHAERFTRSGAKNCAIDLSSRLRAFTEHMTGHCFHFTRRCFKKAANAELIFIPAAQARACCALDLLFFIFNSSEWALIKYNNTFKTMFRYKWNQKYHFLCWHNFLNDFVNLNKPNRIHS